MSGEMNRSRRLLLAIPAALVAAPRSGAARTTGSVVVIALIDVLPAQAAEGADLLRRYLRDVRGCGGFLDARLLRQPDPTANHFAMVTSWADDGAWDAHIASDVARRFRLALQPVAASPIDQRIYANMVA